MPDDPADIKNLRRIAAAIERIGRYTAGLTAEEFQADTMVQDAVHWNFAVISDRVHGIAAAGRAIHPELPWNELEQLAGCVFEDEQPREASRVWDVVQNDLPPLVGPLGEVLKREGEGG